MCRLLRQNINDQGVVIVCIVIAAVLGGDFFTIRIEVSFGDYLQGLNFLLFLVCMFDFIYCSFYRLNCVLLCCFFFF